QLWDFRKSGASWEASSSPPFPLLRCDQPGRKGDSLCCQNALKFFHGLVYRMIAGCIDDSLAAAGRHRYLLMGCKLRTGGTSDRNQIDRHCQSDKGQEESDRDRLDGRTRECRFAAIQFPDQTKVVPS